MEGKTFTRNMPMAMQLLSAMVVTGIGIIVLLGWVLNNQLLIRIIPSANGMNPITAILFILLGIVIAVLGRPRGQYVVYPVAVILCVAALLRLASIVGIVPFAIDLLFFKERVISSIGPSRVAFFTAIGFLFLGIAALSNYNRLFVRLRIPHIFSGLVIFFSLIGFLGYITDEPGILGNTFFFSVAIHTALLFVFSGMIILYKSTSAEEEHISRGKRVLILSVLWSSVIATVLVVGLIEQAQYDKYRASFESQADDVGHAIQNRMTTYISNLENGVGLFASSNEVTRDEWKTYVSTLQLPERYPGVQGMGYSMLIASNDKQALINQLQNEGLSDFTIYPEGNRDIYSAVIYIEPFNERNQVALGYDMYSDKVRREAMEQARDMAQPVMSGRVRLVQEIDQDVQSGFLIYAPFYGNGGIPTNVTGRRDKIVGYVYSPFRINDLMEGILANDASKIDFHIYDGSEVRENNLMYDSQTEHGPNYASYFHLTKQLTIADHTWTLDFHSPQTIRETRFDQIMPLIVLVGGLLISILASGLLYVFSSSQQRAVIYAEQVTRDLRNRTEENEKNRKKLVVLNENLLNKTGKLTEKISEVEKLNDLMVGREMKMIELKKEIKKLKGDGQGK